MKSAQKAVVIGSMAMKHHYPDFPRIPMDRDIIIRRKDFDEMIETTSISEIKSVKINENGLSAIVKWYYFPEPFEYLFADGQKSLELILDQLSDNSGYASPEVLYSIKKAHIHFPVKFQKHIQDITFLRGKLREKLNINVFNDTYSVTDLLDHYPALTELHFRETEGRLGKLRTPKMNQTTEEFFGKSKKYVRSFYKHDNMHLAVARIEGEPAYHDILKDGSEVETDQNKWNNLNLDQKIDCVLEEAYVIALERKILPWMFDPSDPKIEEFWSADEAFKWAYMRICTTLCDGFFREFAVRACELITTSYNSDYVNKFFKNISKYE
jgi:hypothetical protein